MNQKQVARKNRIHQLLEYLLAQLNLEPDKKLSRNTLLNRYSLESGISIPILREYTNILHSARLIKISGYVGSWWLQLVEAEAS